MSLDKLRRLHEAATKAPWKPITGKTIAGITSNDCQIYMLKDPGDMKFSVPTWKVNAEIGAYLRNHTEAIIALIEAADAVDSDWNRTSAMQLRAALKPFEDESCNVFKRLRIDLEDARVARKKPMLEIGRLLDSAHKPIEAQIITHEKRFDDPIQEVVQKEKREAAARVEAAMEAAKAAERAKREAEEKELADYNIHTGRWK